MYIKSKYRTIKNNLFKFVNNIFTKLKSVSDYFEIPKTDTKIESLHLLFSVYLAIKNSRTQNTTVLASDNSS